MSSNNIQTKKKNSVVLKTAPQNGYPESNGSANVSAHSALAAGLSSENTNGSHPPFPKGKFDIIYADPPWDYKGQLQHNGAGGVDTGGAIRHYPTVTAAEMGRWNIPQICSDDALLFMWATSPHLDQAIDLGKAWGFNWATVGFIWDKERKNPGFYTMSMCELCLIFKRGKIPRPRGTRNEEQLIKWRRKVHSKKPPEVRKRIERMFPDQKKIELFARQKTRGWSYWGLDV